MTQARAETETRILDAARVALGRLGPRRMTMDDVAQGAGVSRITLYRKFTNKDALIEQVVQREFEVYLGQFEADIAGCTTIEERVVRGFASALSSMRSNDLISGLMRVADENFIGSVLGDGGSTVSFVSAFVAQRLRDEQVAGNLADTVDADFVAEIMVRLSTSFLLVASETIDLDDEAAVRRIAERALLPLLSAGPPD